MKRTLAIIISIVVMLSFCACQKSGNNDKGTFTSDGANASSGVQEERGPGKSISEKVDELGPRDSGDVQLNPSFTILPQTTPAP